MIALTDAQRIDAYRVFLKYRRGGLDILLHHLNGGGLTIDHENLHLLALELTEVLDFCKPIAESLTVGMLDRHIAVGHIMARYQWMDLQSALDTLEETQDRASCSAA